MMSFPSWNEANSSEFKSAYFNDTNAYKRLFTN
uniref:Uncharacterized protein n=1 Tax=Rhizophora mucronata TaxID=61149 RepID=A0A2P2LZY7_RHIMU